MKNRALIRGVIAEVRRAVPGVTRDRLEPILMREMPGEADSVLLELGIAFGPPPGLEG